jgi:hypothetical protein
MYPDKFATKVTDVPNQIHWVIIKNGQVYVPGDERSKTNPGHGYPAHTEHHLIYEVFLTKEKFIEAITELENKNEKNYKTLQVNPISVTKEIKVSLQ